MAAISISAKNPNEYTVENLPRGEGIWLRVENFDVKVKRTDEGLVIDVYDASDEINGDAIASAYAFDTDTLAYQEN